jgi:prepilin-type N-terminal cleavage/methylation domain-containing protein
MNMKSGLTLIELMTIVAIVAILASIAIPSFLKAQDKANQQKQIEEQRELANRPLEKGAEVVRRMSVEEANDKYEEIQEIRRAQRKKALWDESVKRASLNTNPTEQDRQEERISHNVKKMFEVQGATFYSATGVSNQIIYFSISDKGISISK